MSTVRDIAAKARVSISTISLVFNHPERVKDETRQRILAIAKELQYRPHGIARDLRIRKTDMIAVLLHHLSGPFYSELIHGVVDQATQYGLTAIVLQGARQPGGPLRLLHERRVDGAIVLDPAVSAPMLTQYASTDLPIVVLDRHFSVGSEYISPVVSDHEEGGYLAGRYLLSLGRQKFGLLLGPEDSTDSQMRQKGFYRALTEAGYNPKTIPTAHGGFTEEGGIMAMQQILAHKPKLDALFSTNDEMAIGAMQVFANRGINVPDDIAIIGFDDIRLSRYVKPSLTTIRQPMYDLGQAAMARLYAMLHGQTQLPPMILPVELIVRQSTPKPTPVQR